MRTTNQSAVDELTYDIQATVILAHLVTGLQRHNNSF